MSWVPITEEEIRNILFSANERMTTSQKLLWEAIRIAPVKWQQNPWGNTGKGFWVVAIIGQTVIWYNDIEEGFNRSTYTTCGIIDEYFSNQDELEWAIQHILDTLSAT